jgi:DNA-binding beta-propeller fold protein YncE
MKNSILLRTVAGGVCLGLFSGAGMLAQNRAGAVGHAALVVVNQGDSDVSIVNPATESQLGTIAENTPGIHGHEAATSPDGRLAYVPIYGSTGVGKSGLNGRSMLVINISSRKIVNKLDFGHEVRPHCAVYDAGSGMLYVTTELDNAVTIINPRTLKIVGKVPTGQEQSHMLALSSDGSRGYTANVGPGTVSVLDMKARKTLAVIPISKDTQRISVSRDDSMAFTADQTQPRLAVIDTATNKLKSWITLPAVGYGTASTMDGRWLLVAMPSANKVAVVDLKSMKVARTIDVPSAPQEVLMRPDGKVAYVSCNTTGRVAAIDLVGWKVQDIIATGKGADGLAWAK